MMTNMVNLQNLTFFQILEDKSTYIPTAQANLDFHKNLNTQSSSGPDLRISILNIKTRNKPVLNNSEHSKEKLQVTNLNKMFIWSF